MQVVGEERRVIIGVMRGTRAIEVAGRARPAANRFTVESGRDLPGQASPGEGETHSETKTGLALAHGTGLHCTGLKCKYYCPHRLQAPPPWLAAQFPVSCQSVRRNLLTELSSIWTVGRAG